MMAAMAFRFILVALMLVLITPAPRLRAEGRGKHAATQRRAVVVDTRRRTYWLHIPDARAAAAPLLIALHGHGGNGRMMQRLTGLDALADREGVVVAYPDGTGWHGLRPLSWNAGGCCGYAQGAGVDDLAFLRALIDDAASVVPLDRERVYVTGISNGAMLAHRAGCELPGIRGIAPVAGTRSVPPCDPAQPVSVVAFHGTADGYVPYAGGRGSRRHDGRVDLAVPQAIARWATAEGCGAATDDVIRDAPQRVTQRTYECPAGVGVALITIDGGGHAWPGGQRAWRFGDAPASLPANDLMWEFFEAQRR